MLHFMWGLGLTREGVSRMYLESNQPTEQSEGAVAYDRLAQAQVP